VTGKPASKLRVGGGLTYTDDTSEYAQTPAASAPASSALLLEATGGLPDIVFRQVALKLFGTYDLLHMAIAVQ
jgi:Putative outer membrane beta-barrel porin, MtrB/PioB